VRRNAGILARGAARSAHLAFPWIALQRWWRDGQTGPPPQLQALINPVAAG